MIAKQHTNIPKFVIPAKAGIQYSLPYGALHNILDSCLRRNDGSMVFLNLFRGNRIDGQATNLILILMPQAFKLTKT